MNTRYYEKYRIQDEDRSMTDVALLQCRGYDLETLREKMAEGLGLTGFPLETFRGARVVVKPNLLSASQPQSAVVTHPQFFQAACEIVLDHGGRPILAESPAVASLRSALRAAGYVPVLKRLGIEAADMSAVRKLSWPGARVMKHFEIAQAFFDADVILNLPKFKTHNLTYITAATKNLFGVIPGVTKMGYHAKLRDAMDFSRGLIDILPALLGKSKTGRNHLIEHSRALALRQGPWKYIEPSQGPKLSPYTRTELGHDPEPQLYNLKDDLAEQKNLKSAEPAKTQQLGKRLNEIRDAGRSRP